MNLNEIGATYNKVTTNTTLLIMHCTDHSILVILLGAAITVVAMAVSVVIHIAIIVVRSRARKRCAEKLDYTSTNQVATEAPVIYEDLDQVNKDIDLENNMAYSAAHTQRH